MFLSVQFSLSVVSDSLQPHGLQHATLPCLSLILGAYSNSSPSSRWCHPTILPSVIPFSSCLQSFPASGSVPRSQFFTSCGQRFRVSASASVLPKNIQDWFPLGWTVWVSSCSPWTLQSLLQNHSLKVSILWHSAFYGPTLTSIHDYWKNHRLTIQTFVSKVMSLLFNTLYRFVIAFLSRSKHLLISRLQSSSTVILKPENIKSVTVSIFSHLFALKWWDCIPWS